ncbi:MAG: sigma-54-dependent Fis family transcriptional regulator [candidate division Zixibacteria bacterium]|nr:sigma-54-dependent Fis family transcriptional regulator [candidate division Zixibacteria bacterium]
MAGKIEILIIDDDRQIVESMSALFKNKGYNPFGVYTGRKGLELALNDVFGLIFLDLSIPDMNSLELIKRIKGLKVSAPIVVITEPSKIGLAIEAAHNGADSIVEKPLNDDIVLHIAGNAINRYRLEQDLSRLRNSLSELYRFIGHSTTIDQFREKLKRIAMSASRALFIGESGSGKEWAAKFVHYSSSRAAGPFCVVNCAAPAADDFAGKLRLGSNLFGHDKDAFVGASAVSKGQFELADGGTLFLDEVGMLTGDYQARLLRAIESGAVTRLGSSDEIKTDVRILAASTIDLEPEVKAGRFREDLYFRLNVIPVNMPPLRTYTDDIPLLARHFLDQAGLIRKHFDAEAIDHLKSLDWPGNLRQLNDTATKAARLVSRDVIGIDDIKTALVESGRRSSQAASAGDSISPSDDKLFRQNISYRRQMIDLEKRLLDEVLSLSDGNITRAARMLQTDRGNLSKKLKKLDIKAKKQ